MQAQANDFLTEMYKEALRKTRVIGMSILSIA